MAVMSQPAILEPAPSHARFVSFALHAGAEPAAVRRALGAILAFTRAVSGAYYFCPPLRQGRCDLTAFGA